MGFRRNAEPHQCRVDSVRGHRVGSPTLPITPRGQRCRHRHYVPPTELDASQSRRHSRTSGGPALQVEPDPWTWTLLAGSQSIVLLYCCNSRASRACPLRRLTLGLRALEDGRGPKVWQQSRRRGPERRAGSAARRPRLSGRDEPAARRGWHRSWQPSWRRCA